MGPIDAAWHLLSFFAPAFGLALLAASAAKLVWRRELAGARWWRLAGWAFAACSATSVAGLVWFGRDGKMATYGAMVLACALALGWAGFVRPR